jgi:chromosome segregation ATPase
LLIFKGISRGKHAPLGHKIASKTLITNNNVHASLIVSSSGEKRKINELQNDINDIQCNIKRKNCCVDHESKILTLTKENDTLKKQLSDKNDFIEKLNRDINEIKSKNNEENIKFQNNYDLIKQQVKDMMNAAENLNEKLKVIPVLELKLCEKNNEIDFLKQQINDHLLCLNEKEELINEYSKKLSPKDDSSNSSLSIKSNNHSNMMAALDESINQFESSNNRSSNFLIDLAKYNKYSEWAYTNYSKNKKQKKLGIISFNI